MAAETGLSGMTVAELIEHTDAFIAELIEMRRREAEELCRETQRALARNRRRCHRIVERQRLAA